MGTIIQAPWAGGSHLWTGGGWGHSTHSAHGEKLAVCPTLATFLLLRAALLAEPLSPLLSSRFFPSLSTQSCRGPDPQVKYMGDPSDIDAVRGRQPGWGRGGSEGGVVSKCEGEETAPMALIYPEAGTKSWGNCCGGDETSDESCGS